MKPPTTQKEVQNFIYVVYYCCNTWPWRSHMFAPVTKITSNKRNIKWTKIRQDAFDEIKRIVASNTLSTYPDFNELFRIHTDTSTFKLGVVIIQKGKPITFYGRELTDAQQI